MEPSRVGRPVAGALVAIAMLAGCGGAAPGSVPTASSLRSLTHHHTGSQSQFLYLGEYKYVGSDTVGKTIILSYPSGHKIATIKNYGPMCTDVSGNVYITGATVVTEYAPGNPHIVGQVTLPSGVWGLSCAADPSTGAIAVCGGANSTSRLSDGWVGVYPSLTQAPLSLTDNKALKFQFCGYDNAGNLFLDGFCDCSGGFYELPRGTEQFVNFPNTVFDVGPTQWDGQYITVEHAYTFKSDKKRRIIMWRLGVSGSSVSIVGTTYFSAQPGAASHPQYTWINGNTVVRPYGSPRYNDEVGYWLYPQGGSPYKVLKGFEYVEYPLVSTSSATYASRNK